MTDILVADYIISFAHAMKLIKKLKVKKHAALGFYYELEDLNRDVWSCRSLFVPEAANTHHRTSGEEHARFMKRVYADYRDGTPAFRLKVFRPA